MVLIFNDRHKCFLNAFQAFRTRDTNVLFCLQKLLLVEKDQKTENFFQNGRKKSKGRKMSKYDNEIRG